MIDSERRHLFNQVAQLYDAARPGYPGALFDDILSYANLPQNARILEVGCGTGQATLPLARRGYAIDCIEPGPALAAIARDKLAAYPAVNVICADFESFASAPSSYHLLLSATAFHWIDPELRFRKAHDLLKPAGTLALFWHRPAQSAISRHFMASLQQVYARVVPEMARDFTMPPHPSEVTTEYEDLIPGSGFFKDLAIRKHDVATRYSAAAYVNLLLTFSDHRALDTATRNRLCAEVETLIQTEFAGEIVRETVALLYLARRK